MLLLYPPLPIQISCSNDNVNPTQIPWDNVTDRYVLLWYCWTMLLYCTLCFHLDDMEHYHYLILPIQTPWNTVTIRYFPCRYYRTPSISDTFHTDIMGHCHYLIFPTLFKKPIEISMINHWGYWVQVITHWTVNENRSIIIHWKLNQCPLTKN
jgi:hypothetical protein